MRNMINQKKKNSKTVVTSKLEVFIYWNLRAKRGQCEQKWLSKRNSKSWNIYQSASSYSNLPNTDEEDYMDNMEPFYDPYQDHWLKAFELFRYQGSTRGCYHKEYMLIEYLYLLTSLNSR